MSKNKTIIKAIKSFRSRKKLIDKTKNGEKARRLEAVKAV